ncbi:MAG: NEW3 domain-containing protein [Armatimonadota bacterium]
MKLFHGFCVFLLSLCTAALAAPDWIDDPATSKWILFGGQTGIAEMHGISLRDKTGEGDLAPATRAGIACGVSKTAKGVPGYFYLITEPADGVRAWLGQDGDVLLTVRYFDGAPGAMAISYDSADPRVKRPPYPNGVWRKPDTHPNGVTLAGDGKWKTLKVRLQLPYFARRCHGADVRLDPISKDVALAGVAFTPVPKGESTDVLVKQELRVERAQGLTSFGTGARFAGTFVQQADEPIVMEAELATSFTLFSGRTPGFDGKASGGAYLHFVDAASWTFTVKTPGKYIMWERGSFPWAGGWNHDEVMDGKTGGIVVDSTGVPKEGWQWIKARAYDLTAGRHTFSLSYHAGARLDMLVLSRQDTPPDLTALKSSYQGPTSGEVWTSPVRPFDVARWRSVTLEVPAGAKAEYEISTDGGKSWQPFDPKSDLSKIPVAGGGKDSLQFHVKLQGAAGALPPLFGGGTVVYQAGENNTKIIENARLRLEIDPYGVKSLYDKKVGTYVSQAAQLHASLATVMSKKPGFASLNSEDLYNSSLEAVDVGGTTEAPVLTMTHLLASGIRLVSTAKLLPSGQMEWKLRIDNPTDLEVAGISFPTITGVKLGDVADDDWIFMPKYWGQVWKNPAANKQVVSFWGPMMRWTALWDDKQGLYLGIEDSRFDDYGFVYGGDSAGGMTLSPTQLILAKPRSTWESATYRLAVTGPDWHEGADIYRNYVATALKPCDVPPYLKWQVDNWTTQPSNDMPTHGWDAIRPTPEILMAANRQMTDGADSGYCGLYPYPALAWGSVREFSQKLAVRRAMGGTYTPYHNFHLWSPGYGHYKRIGSFPKARIPQGIPVPDDTWYKNAATYSFTGSYSRMESDYFAQLGMAMGSKEWRDWLSFWTEKYLGWGADGMYYDQFNMIYGNGRLYPDFDTYGCWAPATLDVFSKMKKAGRAKDPYFTSSGEAYNDVYGQYIDMHMTSGVVNRLEFYQYCNPCQIIIDGGWNGGLADAFGGMARRRFIWQVGARFEGYADPRQLALRGAVKSLLYDAQFRDTVGLAVRDAAGKLCEPVYTYSNAQNAPSHGVIGRWFLYNKGKSRGAVVNLINAPGQRDDKGKMVDMPPLRGAKVTFSTKETGPITSAVAWTLDGKHYPLKGGVQQGENYIFPVPESELSTVVLSAGLPPVVEWSIDPITTPGATRKLTVKLTNVNASALEGSATMKLPAGWTAAATKFGPLGSGETLEFTLPVTVPAKAKLGRQDIRCEINTPTGTFFTYNFLTVNAPVIADFRGNPGSYHIWLKNLTSTTMEGAVSVTVPAGLTAGTPAKFSLPPEAEIRVPVAVNGQHKLSEVGEMQAKVTVGALKFDLVRGLMPTIPNGSFEVDSAGDMKPDWWMGRKLRDEWSYEYIHLATGAHSGKYCLMIDPPKEGDQFIRAYQVNGILKPNTRYRASVWIKSESKTGVYVNIMGRLLGSGQTSGEWQQFTYEFTTPDTNAWPCYGAYNHSPTPAYYDDLVIEEISAK